ncbi:MAG: uracil-DNA glycosylase [Verrucomicrobiota bacterium]
MAESRTLAQACSLLSQALQVRKQDHMDLAPAAREALKRLAGREWAKAAPEPKPPTALASSQPAHPSKAAQLAALREELASDPRATSLESLRETLVFSVGHPDATFMFVGEAPGFEEERQAEPFVGPAGQLLTKIIAAMGFARGEVYISNIVKFRPSTGAADQGTANRKPTVAEMSHFLPYLKREIEIVQPKIIIALGGTAHHGLTGKEASVGSVRGKILDLDGTPLLTTYHPSYLLRNRERSEKKKVWDDMKLALQHLGLTAPK